MALYKWQNIIKRIKHIENPIGVEVGVWRGDMSIRLLENMPELTLFMVDLWSPKTYSGKSLDAVSSDMKKEYEQNCINNYQHVKEITEKYYERAIILKQDSVKTAAQFENRYFDFIFLDGDHSKEGLKKDILAWFPKIKTGGFICGHDYDNPIFPGVKIAVDEIFKDAVIEDSDFTWFVKI